MARWALWLGAAALLGAACRPAAAPTTCARADVLLRGACVDGAVAVTYCGPAALWDEAAGACVLRPCDEGQVRDRISGACLGPRALRSLAERQHVVVEATDVIGCGAGLELRVAAENARCVDPTLDPPPSRACRRGEVWDGKACASVVHGGRVDVAAWARATFGPPGATSERFCARAALETAPFGLLSGASTTFDASVELVVPDNDMTALYARVTSLRPMPAGGLAHVVSAVDAEVDLLRALGGTAEVAGYTQPITCTIRAGTSPVAVPRAAPEKHRTADENR